MPMHQVVVRWIAWRWAIGPGQERLSPAGRPSPTPGHGRGAVPVVVPSPAHITEPVLRHTSLGECPSNWLDATVCRYRFPSVRSIRLARWSTGPRCGLTDEFSAPCWSVRRIPTHGRPRHAETDLWHEPEPGRLHRRARRRPRLERAERRAVPVVVRPGGGDGLGGVRVKTVGDDA